jgi:tetratricopeptide (TPR) repeat protein
MVTAVAFSPDGKTILTGCSDNAARLWDAVTGRPIGRPMPHGSSRSGWLRAAFSPDGRFVLTNDFSTARLWDVPAPLPEDIPRLAAWVAAATGLELDERGSIQMLDRAAWLERRSRLERLGGPPAPDPAARPDPILFGAEPAARGDAWKQRGQWDRAEDAYAEAIRARPLDRSIRDALARLHAERGDLDRAAATLADAVGRIPEDAGLRRRWGLALLGSGDRSGWRGATAALLDRFGSTIDPQTASDLAWACASGPEATGDPQRLLRLAEAAVEGADEFLEADAWRYLGADEFLKADA